MATWIALLRGINVSGKNLLPMKELVADLESLGYENVRTYIQSGNAIFESPARSGARLGDAISEAIESRHGFRPPVLVLSRRDLAQAIDANPFPEAEDDPKSVHLLFLAERPPRPDLAALEALRAASERFELEGKVMYLHAPEGIARSKLAARAEKTLGVDGTGRNWRTVRKLEALADAR